MAFREGSGFGPGITGGATRRSERGGKGGGGAPTGPESERGAQDWGHAKVPAHETGLRQAAEALAARAPGERITAERLPAGGTPEDQAAKAAEKKEETMVNLMKNFANSKEEPELRRMLAGFGYTEKEKQDEILEAAATIKAEEVEGRMAAK